MTRKEALKVLIETKEIPHLDTMPNRRVDEALSVAIEALKSEPKHGRWRHYEGTLTCSVCHTEIYDDIMELLGDDVPRYCPNCGARMDEVTECGQ